MSFRITGLPAEPFAHLFSLSDDELRARGAVRRIAEGNSPCRVSLSDAQPGDELILVNYEHQPADSPYRSTYAIFVREGEEQYDRTNEVPEQLRRRLLSVRGFDDQGMLLDADVTQGTELESLIDRLFDNRKIAYLHVHNARYGCYAARVDRA